VVPVRAAAGDSRIPSIQIHSDATPAGGGLDLGPIHRVTLRGAGRVLHVRASVWTPREWTTLDIDLKTVAQKIFIEGDVGVASQDLHLRDLLLT
jgi:hypothetical protein